MQSPAVQRADIWIPPPVYPLSALAVGWALGRFVPLASMPFWMRVVGACTLALSLAVAGWAVVALLRHRTPIDPYRPTTALVTTGPFARSRNPIYVAFLLGQLGLSLLLDWPWAALLVPVTGLTLHWRVVRKEEQYLHATFAAPYDDYRKRVRRWL